MRDDVLLDAIGKTVGQTLAKVRAELGLETDEKLKVVDELVRNHLIQYVKEYTDVASTSLTELLAEEVATLERKADEQGDAITLAQADYADKLVSDSSETIKSTLTQYVDAQVADTHNTLHDKINDVVASIPEIRNGIDGVDGIDGKDGESVTGERGDDGVDGRDGLDRPIVEPVDLDRDISYPKGTTGSYEGGLWISSKESTGNPSSDPHAWSCILDSMSDLSVAVQEDRSYKLSIRMATGKVIDTSFDIPFPEHKGIWSEGEYLEGQIVTKGHSMWMAINDTAGSPPGNGWQQILTAPKGKTGPEGKSITGPQGVPGRNGRDGADAEIDWDIQKLFVEGIVYTDQRSASYPLRSFRGWYSEEESYLVGDVVREGDALIVVTQAIPAGSKYATVAYESTEVMFNQQKNTAANFMLWKGEWEQGQTYNTGYTVRDGDWTMVAINPTTDRAAPLAIGDSLNAYTGSSPETSTLAKQITQGAKYTSQNGVWINGYRVYTITGNFYRVYSINSVVSINELISFEADVTGWVEFAINPMPLRGGAEFSVVSQVSEPDPTPTVWTANYDYDTPNNLGTPGSGVILHANGDTSSLRINKTDNDGGDRGAELEALLVGDIINSGGISWAIQTVADNGSWMNFAIAPAVQDSPDGVREFSFETVTATPITYLSDPDYYISDPRISGLLGVDVPLESVVPDDNAYGVDLVVQEASISPDWDVVAYGGVSGGAASQLTAKQTNWVAASTLNVNDDSTTTTDDAWTEIDRAFVPQGRGYKATVGLEAKRLDAVGYHSSRYTVLAWDDNGAQHSMIKEVELGQDLTFRAVEIGNDLVYEVRGKNNQQWSWGIDVFYLEID